MKLPNIRKNGPRPPGALPKNLQYIVLAVIALLVISTSFFSGKKERQPEAPKSPLGSTPAQIAAFQQALDREGREAAEAKRYLEEKRLRDEQARQASLGSLGQATTGGVSDRLEELRRERAAKAPFASNFVVRPEDKDDRNTVDVAPQIVYTAEQKKEETAEEEPSSKDPSDVEQLKESGRRLVETAGNLNRVYEGTLVQTVLANSLDGSFTGPVLCIVSKDLRSKAGVLLIPKGSQFIGKASRVEAQNQVRLLVTFKRLVMPNGYSVDLEAAPGLENAGETGLKDKVNNHHARAFSISGAIGLLGGLALYAGQGSLYAAGVANSVGSSATTVLNRFLNTVPTVTIRKGHSVAIYLPNDLVLPEYRP